MIIKKLVKKLVKQFLKKRYNVDLIAHYSSFEARLARMLKAYRINVTLDVGANIGQFAMAIRKEGYEGKIISFEPVKEAFLKLLEASKKDCDWECHRMALGIGEKECFINVSQKMECSSLMDMMQLHLRAVPGAEFVRKEKVAMTSLDQFYKDKKQPDDKLFVKIDTQGYEAEVMEGLRDIDTFTKLILLELSVEPLYSGQHLYMEMIERLSVRGYVLVLLNPIFYDTKGHILQFDAVFAKK